MYDVNEHNPPQPTRPHLTPPNARTSLVPVVMVLVPTVIFIFGIVAFTGRAGLLILAAIASVPAFLMLHYLLWGYWLGNTIRGSQPDEADRDAEQ